MRLLINAIRYAGVYHGIIGHVHTKKERKARIEKVEKHLKDLQKRRKKDAALIKLCK